MTTADSGMMFTRTFETLTPRSRRATILGSSSKKNVSARSRRRRSGRKSCKNVNVAAIGRSIPILDKNLYNKTIAYERTLNKWQKEQKEKL